MVIGFGVAAEMLQLVGDVTVSLQLIVAATTVCSLVASHIQTSWNVDIKISESGTPSFTNSKFQI